ncbi:hypothetical protein TrRE_jg1766 [Triparma retinervis]|uniref:Histidinol dehydrogenase n=1 Tax=Triparma retinervis TaxID=2557542 RepID=A0A9W7A393_9STRA|nr:hypothetical protein TrRE_jg1766 [Triparma retinervis]
MSAFTFPVISPSSVSSTNKDPVDPVALEQARAIVNKLKESKTRSSTLMEIGHQFGDIPPTANTYIIPKSSQKAAYDALPPAQRSALDRIHARVSTFASAQLSSLTDLRIPIPGGHAGHTVTPCKTAGCYAPGGRYPLPSSVIMTVATAKAAGCGTVVLASPRPKDITMAAAWVSGADVFVGVGGAQAIAAMAYGVEGDAAKSLVNGHCGIDMLAGPSEVLVICDETCSVPVVAADLIAQCEHDVVARAILVSDSRATIDSVISETERQLALLPEPNRSTAIAAYNSGFAVECEDMDECVKVSDVIAPEHLEVMCKGEEEVARKCRCYGGLFIGLNAAEVLGDYGCGPNHTLPTGGTGRYTGGLSVFSFLGIRTWIMMGKEKTKENRQMVEDTVIMARCEGLEGHARAAEKRL